MVPCDDGWCLGGGRSLRESRRSIGRETCYGGEKCFGGGRCFGGWRYLGGSECLGDHVRRCLSDWGALVVGGTLEKVGGVLVGMVGALVVVCAGAFVCVGAFVSAGAFVFCVYGFLLWEWVLLCVQVILVYGCFCVYWCL